MSDRIKGLVHGITFRKWLRGNFNLNEHSNCHVCYEAGEDSDANEVLHDLHATFARVAKRMLLRFPIVRRWDETLDIAHLAFLRVEKKLASGKSTSPKELYALAAKYVRWTLIDLARKYAGPNGISSNHDTLTGKPVDFMERIPDTRDAQAQPARLVEWSEFHETVEELPNEAKTAFDLLWYGGLSQAEAAEMLGVHESTVKRRWRKARLLLAENCIR